MAQHRHPLRQARHHLPGRDLVRLDEIGEARLALGNCGAATGEAIEHVGAAELGAEWLDEITINRTGGGAHVAVLAGNGDGYFVIDSTARQFSPDLPFPCVASPEAWQAAVQEASGTGWAVEDSRAA